MKDFRSLFGNQFASGIVASDIHTKNFTEDMLVRYAHYNTSGQYDVVINLTETAYNAFFGQITNKAVLMALRISRTNSVNTILGSFEKSVTHIGNVVAAKFVKGSDEYLEFFPLGLSDYHNATKEKFPTLISVLKAAVDNHSAAFDPAFVTMIHDYQAKFDNARGVQLEKKEDVTAIVQTKAITRGKLELQLSLNLLNLAIEFMQDPEKGWAFFNQNLLNPTHKHPQGGDLKGDYVLNLPFGKKTRADFKLQDAPDYYLMIHNTGNADAIGYTCKDTTGDPVPMSYFKLAKGETKVFSYQDMGGMDYLFFYFTGTDTAITGQVTITQVDAPIV